MKTAFRFWAPLVLVSLALGAGSAVAATLTLTPDSGVPGDTILVDGSGWDADDEKLVEIVEAGYETLSSVPVDGVFTATLIIPDIAAGEWRVFASSFWGEGTDTAEVFLTVLDATAEGIDTAIDIVVESDVDGDGANDSTVSPFSVLEYGEPASTLTFTTTGGSGGEYTLTFSNLPGLGYLVDPTTTFELVEGSVLTTTGGSLTLEFVGVPQATASFSDSDSFIVRASDDSGNSAPVIVDLVITDVNQPIVVDREPSAVVAASTTATIALVDFTDLDGDGEPDPSVYDTDGDAFWFEAPLGVSDLGASVSVTGGTLTYYAWTTPPSRLATR